MTAASALRLDTPASPFPLALEREGDAAAVEALVAEAFGPGRFAKTAERVREHARFRPDLSLCAWNGTELAGAVRLWSVTIGEGPALFLGPIAVAAHLRGRGVAAALVERACALAVAAGETAVVLVGDLSRFGPMGFSPVPAGRIVPPGPVDPRRILWRGLAGSPPEAPAGAMRGERP
jgi:predicted N-acetyltransferase YhbS